MIAEEGFDRGLTPETFVSEEELQELLKEIPHSAGEAGAGPLVLFVSRRGAGAALLEERLQAAGARVQHVRNPFSALDQLRRTPPAAVVSELELWANGGALLLARLRPIERSVPVLFLSDSKRDREAIDAELRSAGAWRVLFQPIEAGLAESAARGLLEAAGPGNGSAVPEPALPPEDSALERSALLGLEEALPSREPAGRNGDADAELSWLRFHVHVSRSARGATSREDLVKRVLEGARARLGARGALFLYTDGSIRIARLEAEPELPDADVASLGICAASGRIEDAGALRIELARQPARAVLALAGLPPEVRSVAPAFIEDVRHALHDALEIAP